MASGLAGYGSGNAVRVHRLGKRLYVVGDLDTAARPGTGLMAPRVGVAAHLQANMVCSAKRRNECAGMTESLTAESLGFLATDFADFRGWELCLHSLPKPRNQSA